MSNVRIELMDEYKSKLIESYECYIQDEPFTLEITLNDAEYRNCRRILLKIIDQMGNEAPFSLGKARTTLEFFDFIHMELEMSNRDIKHEIIEIFNDCINFLEEGQFEVQLIKVNLDVPSSIDFDKYLEKFIKCEKRLEDRDYSGVVTLSQSIVEGVIKHLLDLLDVKHTGKEKFPQLFTSLSNNLNLDAKDEKNKKLRQVISGFNSVVHGLNQVRNDVGDGHDGKKADFHHALLTLNSAKTMTSFLFHTYEYQKEKGYIGV